MTPMPANVACVRCWDKFQIVNKCKYNCLSKRRVASKDHCVECERLGEKKRICNCGCGRRFRPNCRFRLKRDACWHSLKHHGDQVIYSLPELTGKGRG